VREIVLAVERDPLKKHSAILGISLSVKRLVCSVKWKLYHYRRRRSIWRDFGDVLLHLRVAVNEHLHVQVCWPVNTEPAEI
jgi:hypothetical protein